MTKAEEKRIMRAAIDTYGAKAQTLMMFEEMSELQKALCKFPRARNNMEKAIFVASIQEEIADVEIMLEQMKLIYDLDGLAEERVENTREHKLERLRERLNIREGR